MPVLTAQPPSRRHSSRSGSSTTRHRSLNTWRWLTRRSTPRSAREDTRRRRRIGLYLRAALADLDLPPPPAQGAREQWERLYDRRRAGSGACCARGARPAGSGPRPSERPPAGRARTRARARPGPRSRPRGSPVERALPPSDAGRRARSPARRADRRIEERAAAMFEQGVVDEVEPRRREPAVEDG